MTIFGFQRAADGLAGFDQRREIRAPVGVHELRRLAAYGWPGFSKMNLWRQDKGQKDCTAAFVRAIHDGGPAPIAFDELIEVSRMTIELAE